MRTVRKSVRNSTMQRGAVSIYRVRRICDWVFYGEKAPSWLGWAELVAGPLPGCSWLLLAAPLVGFLLCPSSIFSHLKLIKSFLINHSHSQQGPSESRSQGPSA